MQGVAPPTRMETSPRWLPKGAVDLHVAAIQLLLARLVAVAQPDPVRVVRAWLPPVLDVDLVPERSGAVNGRLTEDARRGQQTVAGNRDHADRVDVEGLGRA